MNRIRKQGIPGVLIRVSYIDLIHSSMIDT